MLVPWNESNNLGIPVIDEQHRKLYAMLNELNQAMAEGCGREVAADVMNRLPPLIREHFETEEMILQQRHSPVYHRCCAKHAEQLSTLQFFLSDKSASDPSAVIDLLYFLDSLLDGHVHSDRQALGLNNHGVIQ